MFGRKSDEINGSIQANKLFRKNLIGKANCAMNKMLPFIWSTSDNTIIR